LSLTPEQVLGEYWNDPLFGSAATHHSATFELLHHRIWPQEYAFPADKNIQIVIENRTDQQHLIAFDKAVAERLRQPAFQEFIKETLAHANENHTQGRHHSHGNSNVDDAAAIVKTLAQQPTVFVRPKDTKEILIKFEKTGRIYLFCALDGHHREGWIAELTVSDKVGSASTKAFSEPESGSHAK